MPRPTALRRVASNVQEIAFLPTLWAFIRRSGCRNEKAALGTFPVREATCRADIPIELAISGIATVRTDPFLVLLFHVLPFLLFDVTFYCLNTFHSIPRSAHGST
jgi:hypothetical protein